MNNSILFHEIGVSYDEKLLKRRSSPQAVSITTRDFFKKYYPRLYDWDWNTYFADRDGFYNRIPSPLTGKLWYKGPIDFMYACYFRIGMVACVSEKIKQILLELDVDKKEYFLHPIVIPKEEAPFYVLFVPFLSISELKIDFNNSLFVIADNEQLRTFKDEAELSDYISNRDNLFRAKELVLDKSLCQKDIINAGFIHGNIYFSDRIIQAFEKEQVIGYEVCHPGSIGTAPLSFSNSAL